MEIYRDIGKYISIIQRLKNIYLSKKLSDYQIGCGQQFFLLQIFEHPGISLQELAELGYYDKATATRAVRKLEDEQYVFTKTDKTDKRLRHIYVTDKAGPVIRETWALIDEWNRIILKDIPEEERRKAESLLKKMAGNAHIYMEQQRRKE